MTVLKDFDSLPTRRYERRIVVVVDLPTAYAFRDEPDARSLRSREDVAVLYAGADPAKTDRITRGLERRGLLVPGNVLVASPYRDGDYTPLAGASDALALHKWAAVATLCGYLGANSLSVRVVADEVSNKQYETSAAGSRMGVGGSGSLKHGHVERFASKLQWEDSFSGAKMDLDKARDHLQSAGLDVDPELRSLVDGRAHDGNALVRRRMTIDLNRESQQLIDAALSVKVPSVLQVSSSFTAAKNVKAHYTVQFDVDFRHARR